MDENTLVEITTRCFSETGGLSQFKQGYRPNDTQIEYALDVARTLDACDPKLAPSVALLEAETGTGKTLGYLLPLMFWAANEKKRVVVSTYTNHLQYQIGQKGGDLDVLVKLVEKFTGVKLVVALRFGMRHYVARSRAKTILDSMIARRGDLSATETTLVNSFRGWLAQNPQCMVHDWLSRYGQFPFGMSASDIFCESDDTSEDLAFYRIDAAKAQEADIVIIPHALLIHNIIVGGKHLDNGQPVNAIVIDEADRLQEVAESMNTHGAAIHILSALLRYADAKKFSKEVTAFAKSHQILMDAMESLRTSNKINKQMDAYSLSEEDKDTLLNAARPVYKLGKAIVPSFSDEESQRFEGIIDSLQRFISVLNKKSDESRFLNPILQFSAIRHYPSLSLVPAGNVDPLGAYVNDNKLTAVDALIVTSATLTGGSKSEFDYLVRTMRLMPPLTRIIAKSSYSPSEFGSMRITLSSHTSPVPILKDQEGMVSKLWLKHAAKMILMAAAKDERVLVLCLSYDEVNLIAELLTKYEDRLIVHRRNSTLNDVLTKFSSSSNGILLSPSAWEGVDLPGLIDHLVITRIPFSPPGNSFAVSTRHHMKRSGYSDKRIMGIVMTKNFINASKRLRQGIGRGIRSPDDSVHLWVCDPRFPSPAHPSSVFTSTKRFVNALPKRFREGTKSAWSEADIFKGSKIEPKVIVKNPW